MKSYNSKEDALRIGQKIAEIRRSSGITQEKLSELLGIGVTHMGRAERGRESLSTNVLLKFCRQFHISPDELIAGEASPDQAAVYETGILELISSCDPLEYRLCRTLLMETIKYLRSRELSSASR